MEHNDAEDDLDFQDVMDDLSNDIFVGREVQIDLFLRGITAPKPPYLILSVHGQGGVGKTTLLKHFQRLAQAENVTAYVDEDYLNVLDVLARLAEQINEQHGTMSEFEKRQHKYRELKEKVEGDPDAPRGALDFVVRGVAKVGMKLLKRVPVAGEVADVFLTDQATDEVANQFSAFTAYVAHKFTNKDERELLLEPEKVLTQLFIEELSQIRDTKIVLFFDTFEKTAKALEKWLIDVIGGRYGRLKANLRFVIAGRFPLKERWLSFKGALKHVEITKFTEDEARKFLAAHEIDDAQQVLQLIKLSECLPVLLTLLVSLPASIDADVSGDAVERFLQEATPEQRDAALAASVPRYFNLDILKALLGDEKGADAFQWLSDAAYVRDSVVGWRYHDVVRSMMLKFLRRQSLTNYELLHAKLIDYFEKTAKTIEEQEGHTDTWVELSAGCFYHQAFVRPLTHPNAIVCFFLNWYHANVSGISEVKLSTEVFKSWLTSAVRCMEQAAEEWENLHVKRWSQILELVRGDFKNLGVDEVSVMAELEAGLKDEHLDVLCQTAILVICTNYFNETKRLDSAVKYVDRAKQISSNSSFIYSLSAKLRRDLKDYSAALADFTKAIELQPADGVNYYWRGITYDAQEDYAAALADFTKAIELQPEDGVNYRWRGITYYEQKEYAAALADFTKAIELQPQNGYSYYWRGSTYYAQKEYAAALADFTKAIELQPEDGVNYRWRGSTYDAQKEYAAALADFTKAIELQPQNGYSYYWRGSTYDAQKEYAAALADFTKAIELQPADGVNYRWRGITYYEQKEYAAALADFTKAIELQPEDGVNYYWRGRTYYEQKEYATALADFTKAIELQPADGTNYNWRGSTYYAQKEYAAALADFTKAIELQPADGVNYRWRGITYYEQKEYAAALADFTKAIELQPEDGDNYYWRGITYYEQKEYAAALADFTKAIELQPEDGANYNRRGSTYYAQKEYAAALADFTKAIELQPADGANCRWRGRTYDAQKEYAAALADFTKAIELQPADEANYYWRGRTYYAQKEYAAALADFTKAIELQPEDGVNISWRACTYLALGDVKMSNSELDSLHSFLVTNSRPAYHAARALALINLIDQANDWLERALKGDPSICNEAASESDLDNLREMDRFKTIIEMHCGSSLRT